MKYQVTLRARHDYKYSVEARDQEEALNIVVDYHIWDRESEGVEVIFEDSEYVELDGYGEVYDVEAEMGTVYENVFISTKEWRENE